MNASGVKPELAFIDPMLRRRLSPLARGALHVAAQCVGEIPSVRLVYCSRHGDLSRTEQLLCQYARNDPLSPTNFGLSVLNASAGVFSIARKDRAAITAIAAGDESFAWGLLDAHARAVLDPGQPVLYVYADAPVPHAIGHADSDVKDGIAIAILLGTGGGRTLESQCYPGGVAEPLSQAEAFVPCLGALGRASWSSPRRTWNWTMS